MTTITTITYNIWSDGELFEVSYAYGTQIAYLFHHRRIRRPPYSASKLLHTSHRKIENAEQALDYFKAITIEEE